MAQSDGEHETIQWYQVGYSYHALHKDEPWVVGEVSMTNTQSLYTARLEVVAHYPTRREAEVMAATLTEALD